MDIQNEKTNEQSEAQEQQEQLITESAPLAKSKKTVVKKSTVIIAVAIVAVAVIVGLGWRYKGLLVAATVNGSPISRLTVIGSLEKSAGKQTLETLINKKLVNDEARKKGISVSKDEISAQIKTIEEQVVAQGQTLEQALVAEGLTRPEFENQVAAQKELEKLLADKIAVSDEEASQYLKDSAVTRTPAGQEEAYKTQAKNQLSQQKFSEAATALIESLRAQAKINYFVNY